MRATPAVLSLTNIVFYCIECTTCNQSFCLVTGRLVWYHAYLCVALDCLFFRVSVFLELILWLANQMDDCESHHLCLRKHRIPRVYELSVIVLLLRRRILWFWCSINQWMYLMCYACAPSLDVRNARSFFRWKLRTTYTFLDFYTAFGVGINCEQELAHWFEWGGRTGAVDAWAKHWVETFFKLLLL